MPSWSTILKWNLEQVCVSTRVVQAFEAKVAVDKSVFQKN